MSDAIRKLHEYLAKSPSVVYPEDVLAYLTAIEAENEKLRELADSMLGSIRCYEVMLGSVRFFKERSDSYSVSSVYEQWMRLLGIEVDDGTK